MTAFVRSGRPGWRLRTANPLIAGGPDPNAVIQIRDRLAAHAEGPAPTTRWCVCLNLHHQRLRGRDSREPAVTLRGAWKAGCAGHPPSTCWLRSWRRELRPMASHAECAAQPDRACDDKPYCNYLAIIFSMVIGRSRTRLPVA